ncbi:predicted protein [Plenodomus lingam JN3]|uniref:Predicted protein n=1 Tax=Leptosphaeria maculans (strain JN3 / isolate v23.1.3 / race Av1-4-5-6-7-8) TaxID=985895 RepID=E4ZNY8_LEPMJ|nr:predicted protein [Plenodomus lingam JN3]CBX93357.1 predicted protein [Plenodomus lingam JN3]
MDRRVNADGSMRNLYGTFQIQRHFSQNALHKTRSERRTRDRQPTARASLLEVGRGNHRPGIDHHGTQYRVTVRRTIALTGLHGRAEDTDPRC